MFIFTSPPRLSDRGHLGLHRLVERLLVVEIAFGRLRGGSELYHIIAYHIVLLYLI